MSGASSTPWPRCRAGRALSALALATGACALSPHDACASGLDAPIITTGLSGPTTPDAAAIYWNPAALAGIQRTELQLGGALILGHITYQRDRLQSYQTPDTLQFKTPIDPTHLDAGKTGAAKEVSATPFSPTGNMFLAFPVLRDRLALGIGVYVPYAAALSFPEDGPQRWQLRRALIAASFVTASAGYRINEKVSLGAGISYVGGIAELSKVQDFAGLKEFHDGLASKSINQDNDFGPGAPSEVRELDVLARSISLKNAINHGISFNAGLALTPSKDVRFGLTYQHGAKMRYKGDFAIDMSDDFFTQDLSEQGLKYKPLIKADAELSFSLPKRITAGVSYTANDRLTVDGLLSYVLYSDIDAFVVETHSPDLAQPKLGIADRVRVTLPRDWNDTVWVEAGAKYKLNDALLASVSVGYQSPASPDSTIDVASPDGHRILGSVGGVITVNDHLFLSGDIRVQGILPRKVTTSDYDLGNGTYTLVIGTAGGHIRILF